MNRQLNTILYLVEEDNIHGLLDYLDKIDDNIFEDNFEDIKQCAIDNKAEKTIEYINELEEDDEWEELKGFIHFIENDDLEGLLDYENDENREVFLTNVDTILFAVELFNSHNISQYIKEQFEIKKA